MRSWWGLLCVAGCDWVVPVEPSANPFQPRLAPVTAPAPGPAPAPGNVPAPGTAPNPSAFDFDSEDRVAGAPARPVSREEVMARLVGGEVRAAPPTPRALASGDMGAYQASAPVWDPSMPLPEVSFGVQVLAVVTHHNPPRAVLVLPDGTEMVVTAGTMLPSQRLLVLAIASNGVQLARVTPNGFSARIATETIGVLAPSVAVVP